MEKISVEKLKEWALNLKLDMSDSQYATLQDEFDILLRQMDRINQTIDTTHVAPMSFPFDVTFTNLRDDDEVEESHRDEILKNAHEVMDGQIKIHKVVE